MRKKLYLVLFCLCLMGLLHPQQAQAAAQPYQIAVNLTQNIVTVYEQDATGAYTVPKKAFLCSAGAETPEGTFRTSDKYIWRPLFGNVYGQYATRITGHILFHSVPYLHQAKNTLDYAAYNQLGKSVSAGCIRLTAADAKWLYDNCPSGTVVRMYRGEKTEPLQPDMPQKIDAADTLRRGWDPTDPDPTNPWLKKTEPAQAQPKAEAQAKPQADTPQLTLQTRWNTRTLDTYRTNGRYFLQAQDMRRLFAHMGITLILPEKAENAEAMDMQDKTTIRYQTIPHEVSRVQRTGQAYYSVREMAELTDVFLAWDGEKRSITLVGGGEQLLLHEVTP